MGKAAQKSRKEKIRKKKQKTEMKKGKSYQKYL